MLYSAGKDRHARWEKRAGDQPRVSMPNTTTHAELDATTRESLELLYHVIRELSAALDLNTVLKRVLFLSMQRVGATSGSIIVLDDKGRPVESAIITGEHYPEQYHPAPARHAGARAGWLGGAQPPGGAGAGHRPRPALAQARISRMAIPRCRNRRSARRCSPTTTWSG